MVFIRNTSNKVMEVENNRADKGPRQILKVRASNIRFRQIVFKLKA